MIRVSPCELLHKVEASRHYVLNGRKQGLMSWSSSMPSILHLRKKLVADGMELVVLESTGDYWRPFFYVLSDQLDLMLVNAFDVRAHAGPQERRVRR